MLFQFEQSLKHISSLGSRHLDAAEQQRPGRCSSSVRPLHF
ncbi:hypothetical protein SS05631_b59110 (plasmid) [Sinorhizobium sp. CCBAU 05631]|nr:hypothetical protein SS05631_b59110 [Sinorhizobium sp. CCBAU 05631]